MRLRLRRALTAPALALLSSPARPTHRVGSTSVARSTLSERILVAAAETDVQLQDPACATCASDSTVQYQH